ncbi:unnamed protein product [Mytilus edulis]|uniref:Uncharacterized protein n=1 Tax=Mytilus edulis TaxID=6550 RepID=A0A8S3PYZ0_MYTED|nr:unnamed protein product [Mytilus edulis]
MSHQASNVDRMVEDGNRVDRGRPLIIEDPSTGLTSGTGPKHIIFQDGVPKVVVRDVPVTKIQRSGCEWRPTKMPMSQMRTWGIPTTEKPTVEPGLITRRLVKSSRVIIKDHHETSRVARKHTILRDGVWKELKWVSPGVNIPLPSEPWWLARVQDARRMDQQRIGQEAAWWARQDRTRCVSGILAGMPSRFALNKSVGRPVRSLFLGKRQLRAGLGRASLRVGGAANRVQAWTDSYLSIGNYAEPAQRMEVPIDLKVEVDAGTADPVLFQAVPIDPIVPKTEPVTEEDMVEEETRVTPTPTRKEETRTSQLRDAVQEAYLEDSDSGLQDLDLEWSKLDEKEERKGVSFLGNLLAQQSKMLKGFKKSPAPAACPAPKVRQFRGERRSSRRKSMVFFPEAADIVQEKQESTDMTSGEDSCDQYVPPPSADDYSSDDSAVESPSDEEAPPAKKRKEVSNEEKDLLDSSAKGFVARTIAEFEASSAGTDVPAVAADVPAEESESDTDEADDPQPADEPVRRTEVPAVAADVPAEESGSDTEADDSQPADEPVRRRTRRAATKVYKGDTKRPRRECQIEGCTAAVVNLRRHMTVCHPDAEAVPVKTKGRPRDQGNRTYGGRLECGLCGSNTIRMDVHLKTVHKLEKDSEEFREAIQGAVPYEEGTQAQQELQQALVDYGKTMTDRACGIARKATTTQSHLTAVKFWLPTGLTRQALLDLEKIGTLDGESEACYPACIPPQLGWVPAVPCRKGYLAPPSASPCRPAHHALRDNEDGEQEPEGGCPHRQGGEPRAWRGHCGSGASADSQVPGLTTTHLSQESDREGREESSCPGQRRWTPGTSYVSSYS